MASPGACASARGGNHSPGSPCDPDLTNEQSSDLQRQRKTRALYPRHATRNGKNGQFSLAGPAGLFALPGRHGSRDSQRLRTGSRSRGTSPARLSAATSPIYLSIATVAQLPQVSRVFSGNGTAMNEMQDDQKHEVKIRGQTRRKPGTLEGFLDDRRP